MKDYYYILGVTSKASFDEIKKAYRKLSTKFHPDKNDGDAFFEERFKEIQEAYEVLSNAVQRTAYDRQYEQKFGNAASSSNGTSYNNFYPVIDIFTASSTKIHDGDEVEFRWNVFNADSVQIDKVGSLPPKGTKRIRISGLRSSKSFHVTLTATNTHIGKSESKTIELGSQLYEEIRAEVLQEEGLYNGTSIWSRNRIYYSVLLAIILVIFTSIWYILKDNTGKESNTTVTLDTTQIRTSFNNSKKIKVVNKIKPASPIKKEEEVPLKEETYQVVEQNPEFPGGLSALAQYLSENIKYPAAASRANIYGKVFLTFVVNTDGSIQDVLVLKGLGFGCDEEALRVVRGMPKWTPGTQSERKVRVKYNLPISFLLE